MLSEGAVRRINQKYIVSCCIICSMLCMYACIAKCRSTQRNVAVSETFLHIQRTAVRYYNDLSDVALLLLFTSFLQELAEKP